MDQHPHPPAPGLTLGPMPPWVPAGTHSERRFAGVSFEVVRCRDGVGELLAAQLGEACGPVSASPAANFCDFLLPLGARVELGIPGVWQFEPDTPVRLPPPADAEGPTLHWLSPPDRALTSPEALQKAADTLGLSRRRPSAPRLLLEPPLTRVPSRRRPSPPKER
nr:hypothetical protein KPHV_86150 [Kitasatospora purpeofusca]